MFEFLEKYSPHFLIAFIVINIACGITNAVVYVTGSGDIHNLVIGMANMFVAGLLIYAGATE